jgi:hypothetical protein
VVKTVHEKAEAKKKTSKGEILEWWITKIELL